MGECSYYRRFYGYFYFLSIIDTLFMYLRLCDHFEIANLVLVDICFLRPSINVLATQGHDENSKEKIREEGRERRVYPILISPPPFTC